MQFRSHGGRVPLEASVWMILVPALTGPLARLFEVVSHTLLPSVLPIFFLPIITMAQNAVSVVRSHGQSNV